MPNDGDNHEVQNEVGAIPTSSPINTDKFIEALDNVQTNQKRLDTKVDNISAEVSKLDSFVTSYVVENGVIVRDIDSLKSELSQQSAKIDELSGSLTNVFNKDNKDKKEKSKEKEDKNSESKEKEESEEKEEKTSNKDILKRVKLSIDNALKNTSSKSLFSTPSLVRITSFSKQGKEELIEGLKQVFTIKKKENSKLNFKTPLIVLTILALIGVFTFLAIKIAAIKKDFEDTVASVKTNKESFITYLTDNLFKTTDSSNNKSLVSIVSDAIEKANISEISENLKNQINPLVDTATQTKSIDDVHKKLLDTVNQFNPDYIKNIDNQIKPLNELYNDFKTNFSEEKYKGFLNQLNNILPNGGNFTIDKSGGEITSEDINSDNSAYVNHSSSDDNSSGNDTPLTTPSIPRSPSSNQPLNNTTPSNNDKRDNQNINNSGLGLNSYSTNPTDNTNKNPSNPLKLLIQDDSKTVQKANIKSDDTVVVINEKDGILKAYLNDLRKNASKISDLFESDLNNLTDHLKTQTNTTKNAISTLNQLCDAIKIIPSCKFNIHQTTNILNKVGQNDVNSSTLNTRNAIIARQFNQNLNIS